jgi:hypothetical protein
MKPRTISKLIAIVFSGILLGGAVHHAHVKRGQLGREDFLAKQADRFDKFYVKPPHIAVEMLVCVIMAGGAVGAYELVVFGLSKLFKKPDDDTA